MKFQFETSEHLKTQISLKTLKNVPIYLQMN
jgi:hypothetical protein